MSDTSAGQDQLAESQLRNRLGKSPPSDEEEEEEEEEELTQSEEEDDEDEAANLTESQTEMLLHYQQICGQSLASCRRQLISCNWNLQLATDQLFGQQHQQQEQQQQHSSSSSSPAASGSSWPTAPPRLQSDPNVHLVQRQQQQQQQQLAPIGWAAWLHSILYFPFRFVHYSLASLIRFVLSFLRPPAIAQRTDPVADVAQFLQQFRQRYGDTHPQLMPCSYSQALDAARSELRFLLVYLHSESHQDTDTFCRSVLCNEAFAAYLTASSINFWMCSISCAEGARVSQALRETGYPFLALIVLKQSRMTIVARFEGLLSIEQLLAEIDAAVTDFEPYLAEERQRRQSLEVNRRLIEEQDQAFAEALARDREREQQRLAEVAEREEADAKQRREEAERQAELQRLRDELPDEPRDDEPEATVKLSIRMPGAAERIERRFRQSEPVRYLHNFVQLQPGAPQNFSLCTNFPRRELPGPQQQPELTFAQAGLTQSEVLFVTDNDD